VREKVNNVYRHSCVLVQSEFLNALGHGLCLSTFWPMWATKHCSITQIYAFWLLLLNCSFTTHWFWYNKNSKKYS